MKDTKKIIVSKNDEPTAVAEKLIDAAEGTIIFSIPRFSRFGEALSNFRLIKREADLLDKTVIIESVDGEVLELAEESGLESTNPFLEERKKRFSDIVPTKPAKKKKTAVKKQVVEEEYEDEEEEDMSWQRGEPVRPVKKAKKKAKRSLKTPRIFRKRNLILLIVVVVVIFGIYLGVAVLPKAEATLVTHKEEWTFSDSITVDHTLTAIDSEEGMIPGQVFIKRDTQTLKFPATGKRFVERKATGELTIYNAHSSQSQPLVVNTRFLTPEGILFRLKSGVVVPGAVVKDGKIIPSSITVAVAADQPGPDSNTGPVSRLSIPGFADSDKSETFYGELKDGAKGGHIGETKVPTETDLGSAKKVAAEKIESELRAQMEEQFPEDFEVLESASKFTIFKQAVDANTDEEEKFTIQIEAQFSVLAFKKVDLEGLMVEKIKADKGGAYVPDGYNLEYGTVRVQDPAQGQMSLPIEYKSLVFQGVDIDFLKSQMKGKSEAGLREVIFGLPGVENAQISLWPFWVRTVPGKDSRIEITVE